MSLDQGGFFEVDVVFFGNVVESEILCLRLVENTS